MVVKALRWQSILMMHAEHKEIHCLPGMDDTLEAACTRCICGARRGIVVQSRESDRLSSGHAEAKQPPHRARV